MALIALDGTPVVQLGPGHNLTQTVPSSTTAATIDAANEAVIMIGHVLTSDGASHTIDTTGSSSLEWRSGTVTFANAGTTVNVGLAAVDLGAGPPGRAVNVSDVITFDVSRTITGGSGGITNAAWQIHVPTAGSKTVASGDLVAFCIQMTARGGIDTIGIQYGLSAAQQQRPLVTTFTGGSYAAANGTPLAVVTFADGAVGYFQACDILSTVAVRTWNSGSATKEYGQLFNLPFPVKIYGAYGWINPSADCDIVLYSDPLGTPVAQQTASLDANTVGSASGRRFWTSFAAPYSTTAAQNIGIVFKPGGSNVSAYYKTLASAVHRMTDVWGTNGYGISRASGAFANVNVSLEHYYIGLVCGAFDAGGTSGRIVRINDMSLVA